MEAHYNVLFLCSGNSARSIMAEAILNFKGKPTFTAYSAGSHPSGVVRPEALKELELARIPTTGLRSKSWDEFARPDSPPLDFVFTVCDKTAGEVCPLWPGEPVTAHWGVADPVAFEGNDEHKRRFFLRIYTELETRIKIFVNLPFESLHRLVLEHHVREIGKTPPEEQS